MSGQKTILVIDDDVDLQELVKMTLQIKGYKVEIAGNGIEGLEKLKTLTPDLIILDMNMPKMGGLEFYQKICVDDKPKYPVLVLTARANLEELFKQFNIDGFMSKPFEIDGLFKEVATIIEKHANESVKKTPIVPKGTRKICIIDNDAEILNKIGADFLSAGYVVNSAKNAVEGIERIVNTVPDVALIKLGLTDIAGDLMILKIKNMAKTQNVKCILYTIKSGEKTIVMYKIGQKSGVERFVEYVNSKDMLQVVNEVLEG